MENSSHSGNQLPQSRSQTYSSPSSEDYFGATEAARNQYGEKYTHSGKTPVVGMVLAYAVGLIVPAIAGIVYCYGVTKIELALVELVFALIFAASIGLPIGVIAKMTKVRSEGHVLLVVFMAATVGLYACWAFHPYFALGEKHRFIAWTPSEIFEWAVLLFTKGQQYNGWFAVVIWTLEAGIVYLLSIGFALVQIDQPFCEKCDCWTERRDGVAKFNRPDEASEAAAQLKKLEYRALLDCTPATEKASYFLNVNMDMCPVCLETCALSCQSVELKINNKGEQEQKDTTVLEKILVEPDVMMDIIAAGRF